MNKIKSILHALITTKAGPFAIVFAFGFIAFSVMFVVGIFTLNTKYIAAGVVQVPVFGILTLLTGVMVWEDGGLWAK